MRLPSRQPVDSDVSGWTRFGVILVDNVLVLAGFLPGFLTGVATGVGATGRPVWLSPVLIVLGVVMGAGVLIGNGGVLAGRGRSLGMSCFDVSLVDESGGHPVGTGTALNRSLISLVFNRVSDEPAYAERHTHSVLVRGYHEDARPVRGPSSSSVPDRYRS